MASLLFFDAGSQLALQPDGRPARNKTAVVYRDAAATTLATIYADDAGTPGAPITGSVVSTDEHGYLSTPIWGPNEDPDVDRLYVRVNSGPAWPVDADNNARIDGLEARVAAVEAGGGGGDGPGLAAHVAATTNVHGIDNTALLETQTSAAERVANHVGSTDPHGDRAYTDSVVTSHTSATTSVHGIDNTALLETQSGAQAKATAAQAAAVAASAQKTANLSDLTNSGTARTNLGLGGAAVLSVGSGAGTVAAGNDGRLSDARTPLAHAASHAAAGSDAVTVAQTQVTGLVAALADKADLIDGVIPSSQLPDLVINATYTVQSEAEMLGLSASVGDLAIRADADPVEVYILGESDPSVLANWVALNVSGTVVSVNGQSGAITLAAADVGAAEATRTITAGAGLTGGGNLTVNRSFDVVFGSTAGTVVEGDDSRLSNARTPTTHAASHAPAGSDPLTGLTAANLAAANVDGVAGTASLRTLGVGAQQAAAGNDSRITGAAQKASNLSDLASAATARTNLGLGNVDNTSDVNKPLSTAATTALAGKVGKGDLVVNVKDHGAVGDGVADDRVAFNDAIAASASGGRILVPPGTYRLASSTVSINKPLTIEGFGATVDVGATDGRLIAASDDVTVRGLRFYTASTPINLLNINAVTNYKNWTFDQCTFVGVGLRCTALNRVNANGAVTATGTGLKTNIKIVRCDFSGYAQDYTVELGGLTGGLFHGNVVHDTGVSGTIGEGLKVLAQTVGLVISDNEFHHCTRDGLDVFDSAGVTIVNNYFHDNGQLGIDIKWTSTHPNQVDKFIVIGNRFVNNTAAMNIAVHRSTIVGNYVGPHTSHGIRVGSAEDSTTATTRYTTIANNICIGSTYGIILGNAVESIVVTGNQCHDNTINGIGLNSQAANCIITDNVCFGNTSRGIGIYGTGHRVVGNRTQDAGNAYIDPTATNIDRGPVASTNIFSGSRYYAPTSGRTTGLGVLNQAYYTPLWVGEAVLLDRIGLEVTSVTGVTAGHTTRLGVYADSGNSLPGTLVLDAGTVASATVAAVEATISLQLYPGLYWLAAVPQGAGTQPTYRCATGIVGTLPVAAGSLASATASTQVCCYTQTGVTGGLPTTATIGNQGQAGILVVVRAAAGQ